MRVKIFMGVYKQPQWFAKAVGIVALICYPHNLMYVTHVFADAMMQLGW